MFTYYTKAISMVFTNIKARRILLFVTTSTILFQCEKNDYITSLDAKLLFSIDTIVFDTVITNIGTVTKQLKVYNTFDKTISIARIYLAGGQQSVFRLNIDGTPTRDIENVEIYPEDSIYIFIAATLDPNNSDSILLIQDSIVFEVNSNILDVDLIAWGQDVTFITGESITTQTWTPNKPYLVYNSMIVDSNEVLTIEAGVTIYFHKGSRMYVAGSIIANGTLENPITFRGDRLDYCIGDIKYDQLPDQWDGIWFLSSSIASELYYCNIRNTKIGIQAGVLGEEGHSELTIKNCKIDNHSYAGIFAINSKLSAENCVISNAGTYTIALVAGGIYSFLHCTVSNYYSHMNRTEPAFVFTNNVTFENQLFENDLDVYIGNSLIYGSNSNEIGIGISTGPLFKYHFVNCLIRQDGGFGESDTTGKFSNVIISQDPKFISTEKYKYNFELDTLSPAKDKGSVTIGNMVPFDILQNSRILDAGPDIGAYERIEK